MWEATHSLGLDRAVWLPVMKVSKRLAEAEDGTRYEITDTTMLRPIRKRIPAVSKKRQVENVAYEKAKRAWRAGHDGRCEMRCDAEGPLHIGASAELYRCTNPAMNNPHHARGRGPFLCNASTFMGICPSHHAWIHDHERQATKLGYLERPPIRH